MEQDYDTKHWTQPCPKYDCRKAACKCGLKYVYLPMSLGDDSPESQIAPKNGAFCDALVVYEANGHIYIYSKEGIPTLVDAGPTGDYYTKGEVNALLLDKQDILTAGNNITIAEVGDDLVISATGSAPTSTKFYFSLLEFDGATSAPAVHIYKDVSLTTAVTAEELRAALYTNGQADFIATEDNGDGPTYYHNLMASGTIPSENGLSGYNGMSIVCFNGIGGGYFSIYTDSGPAVTQFSFTVTT